MSLSDKNILFIECFNMARSLLWSELTNLVLDKCLTTSLVSLSFPDSEDSVSSAGRM